MGIMMVVQKMAPMSGSNVIAVQVRDILNYHPLVALLMRMTTIMKRIRVQNGLLGHHGAHAIAHVVMANRHEHVLVRVESLDRDHVQEMDGKMFKTVNLVNVQHGENGEDGHNVIKLVIPDNRIVLLLYMFHGWNKGKIEVNRS